MRLLPRRSAGATLALDAAGPLRATDAVTATVTLESALDDVGVAVVELGYVNSYRYRWAGRRDAALKHDDMSLVTMGQVGTSYGSDRETSDWVHVLDAPLTFAGGVLAEGTHTAVLRIPSWAPGSSSLVAWEARLRIERAGRDVEESVPLTVLIAAPEPPLPVLELIQGESAIANDLLFDIRTERPTHRPGEEVRGEIVVTPRAPMTRTAKVGVRFARRQLSHPLERAAGDTTLSEIRPTTTVAEDISFVEGETTTIAFGVTLPPDADPTTEAVHSSLDWYVVAEVNFSGMTGAIERARRGIIVHTA